jgi:POT family proton-dependent oligopeptide transporter
MVFLCAMALAAGLLLTGELHLNAAAVAHTATYGIVGVAVLYFVCVLLLFRLDGTEKRRVGVIVVLFLASALFWSGFEQAGSSLNLFAERYTERLLLQYTIPAGWFQSLGAMFVISLAPVVAAVWLRLARRDLNPPLPVKFALGLMLLAAGFLVMAGASSLVAAGQKVWPQWLVTTYLLHSLGELCLSPVGLSSVTKLAPRRLVGQMMGTWFLATSLGNLIAGLTAGRFSAEGVTHMPGRYLQIVLMAAGAGLLLLLCTKPIRKLMTGVE